MVNFNEKGYLQLFSENNNQTSIIPAQKNIMHW